MEPSRARHATPRKRRMRAEKRFNMSSGFGWG
jgi:hypothetical protein